MNRILKIATLMIALMMPSVFLLAGEGMWIPLLLKALNESEMQSMGMKLSAEDIYDANNSSLKDAIVHFGGFCTGEVISDQGLILTNHHCGYSQIQSHSSVENNLLKNGFWAQSFDQELPNPGLFVRFIDRIEDVTKTALEGVNEDMSLKERQSTIDKNLEKIRSSMETGPFQDVIIRPFYNGNQYFAFLTTVYNDVRLVGTPPESIGKFGADTDNWVFPRHTGDFSLFRIYAGPNNEPADYSPENKPYNPKHHLPISLDGVEEGDFTMVFGFPGRTNQYLPSPAVEQLLNTLNPAKIEIRDRALKILDKYMRADEETRIKYASKFARVANYWKKWIGESQGLKATGALDKKYKYEEAFNKKAGEKYRDLLPGFKKEYEAIEPYALARDFYNEVALRNIELLSHMRYINRLISTYENNGAEAFMNLLDRYSGFFGQFYKNYDAGIDQEVFAELTAFYASSLDAKYVPETLQKTTVSSNHEKGYAQLAEEMYEQSNFTTLEGYQSLIGDDAKEIVDAFKADTIYQLFKSWQGVYSTEIASPYNAINDVIDSMQMVYMKAQMETFKDKRFWPDANSTMRITYGKVNGYSPRDAVKYLPFSTVQGIRQKYVPGDYEFDVHPKLLELIDQKDYGQYADQSGEVPVCFIGTNHTTGGNSGSPAIDAYGNLIGLNFDRVWEGTMSDINYDASICRNIMVDARYILFIVDKFAGATHLIDEMSLVRPKTTR